MSGRPSLFLSYAAADRQIGERLHASLERHGCIVHDPANGARNADSGARIEEAVRGSDYFVLLFGRHRGQDRWQEQEWQVALEESWEHPDKRMIPVLLRDAELPSFVRTAAAATGHTVGLHVRGLRDIEEAAELIARTARRQAVTEPPVRGIRSALEPPEVYRGARRRVRDDGSKPAGYSLGAGDVEEEDPATDDQPRGSEAEPSVSEERTARGRELEFVVEPATPEESFARFSDIERYADELEL